MGFMEFFSRKNNAKKLEAQQELTEKVADINSRMKSAIQKINEDEKNNDRLEKEGFVSNLSSYELEQAHWNEFGAELKRAKILPNSYIKKPASVEVSLDKQNRPKVILEFKSATSDSVRKFMLLQDDVFQYVNGAICQRPNDDILSIWNKFQDNIRYINGIKANRVGYEHKTRGEKKMLEANRMIALEDLYKREYEFLQKYQDTTFDCFCWAVNIDKGIYRGELPQFRTLKKEANAKRKEQELVMPFSPKTLEFCILHIAEEEKILEGEYMEDFEEKCRAVQKYSCMESDDWDKVIEFGKAHVISKFQLDCLENGFGM